MHPAVSPLLTDLYQLNMIQEYAGLPGETIDRQGDLRRGASRSGAATARIAAVRSNIVLRRAGRSGGEPLIELVMKSGAA